MTGLSVLAGFLISRTGSFDIPFMVVGAMELFGGVLYFTIKCFIPRYGYKEPTATVDAADSSNVIAKRVQALRAKGRPRQRSRMMSESFT